MNGPRLRAGTTGEWSHRLRVLVLSSIAILALSACAETPRPHLVELRDLPGWEADATFQAYPALLASCGVIETLSSDRAMGVGGSPTEWRVPCGRIAELRAALVTDSDAALRRVMEAEFVALDPGEGTSALVTGYYEPELDGSRTKDAVHRYPLYRRPPDPTAFDRAQIDGGALAGKGLELLWLADPIDAFFLHVQGSGRVRLADGEVVRVGFDGSNDRQYVSIGKAMVDAGIMTKEEASLQSIRAWLQAHPDQIFDWLHKNPRYIFFRERDGVGPIGAQSVALTPERSVATDPAFVPLGAPLWLNTTRPDTGAPLQRLVVAQDKGAAIKGAGRIDFFWGPGDAAEALAGPMRQQGTYWMMVPRAVGQRWLAQQTEAGS